MLGFTLSPCLGGVSKNRLWDEDLVTGCLLGRWSQEAQWEPENKTEKKEKSINGTVMTRSPLWTTKAWSYWGHFGKFCVTQESFSTECEKAGYGSTHSHLPQAEGPSWNINSLALLNILCRGWAPSWAPEEPLGREEHRWLRLEAIDVCRNCPGNVQVTRESRKH